MFAVDLDPIPLADPDDRNPNPPPQRDVISHNRAGRTAISPSRSGKWIATALIILLCSLHGLAIWWGLGGGAGLSNGWPLWRDDHPLYYHSALVTRSFLRSSWTTAGYDPSFMAGYAKSVVFPSSSTLPEVVVAAFGGKHPEFAYKLYVLASAASVPWLIALACIFWRVPAAGAAIAVLLGLLYVWTDFPVNYVAFGMLPYFLAIPTGLAATGAFARFLARGGILNWLLATVLMSLAFLFHLTVAMVVAPAAALAYVVAVVRRRGGAAPAARLGRDRAVGPAGSEPERRLTAWTHLAVWLIPMVVLAVNSFWWLPAIWLASTKGRSDFVFAHPEGVWRRLLQIVEVEAPVETVLLAAGIPGLVVIFRRGYVQGSALLGYCVAGMFWGYLAGGLRALDFLQPGRHTYAFYTALALAGGAGLHEIFRRLRTGPDRVDRLDRWVIAGAILLGLRLLGYPLFESLRVRLGEPFLSSHPSRRLLWVVKQVKRHVRAGERLLYEEGGFGIPGVPDPFQHGRFSGLLPERTGVEVIGGPYLHASLATNFTQFGEGRLFNRTSWEGYDLRLMSSVNDVGDIPNQGKNLIIVAVVDRVLHFRIFDVDGKTVVDTDEKRLPEQARKIEDLRKQLQSPLPQSESANWEKVRLIAIVTTIVGRPPWDRAFFVRYANLYRPSAILCWSPYARRFCRENPDLVKVLEDDGAVLLGRVAGFEGDFIEGKGRVEAFPGRIRVSELTPGLDGSVVLRYHSVPYLSTSPSVACEPDYREDDPVPFIRLRPPAGTSGVELELQFPVGK